MAGSKLNRSVFPIPNYTDLVRSGNGTVLNVIFRQHICFNEAKRLTGVARSTCLKGKFYVRVLSGCL